MFRFILPNSISPTFKSTMHSVARLKIDSFDKRFSGYRDFRPVYCNCSPLVEERLATWRKSIHRWKLHLAGYNCAADSTGQYPFV